MLRQTLYYIYISLYASLNFVIGVVIVCGFAYNPIADFHRIADLITGFVVLAIGVLCFVGLRIRNDNKPTTLNTRRKMGYVLIVGLLPLLIVCLVVNLIITPVESLLAASILSFLAAGLTFILVYRRLKSPLFQAGKKQ